MIGDRTPRGFEHVGKTVFCGQVKRSKQEQGDPEAEDEMEDDAPSSQPTLVVIYRAFILFWLHNHIIHIYKKILFPAKFSKRQRNFSVVFLLHNLHNPIPPPYPLSLRPPIHPSTARLLGARGGV